MKLRHILAIALALIAILSLIFYLISEPLQGTSSPLFLWGVVIAAAVAFLAGLDQIVNLVERFTKRQQVDENPPLPLVNLPEAPVTINIHSGSQAPIEPERQDDMLDVALKEYLGWVYNTYSRLDLRGVEERQRHPHDLTLDDVYVSLTVTVDAEEERKQRQEPEEAHRTVDMHDLLGEGKHIAITGGPGCGKTTYLRVIAATLARARIKNDPEPIQRFLGIDEPLPIPIFISLGEYNRYRRRHSGRADPQPGTIRGFINYMACKRERKTPSDFFDRLLDGKTPIMILLDGLDEVADEMERRLVATEVQHFVDSNTAAIVFITSRTRAYHGQARLADFRLAAVQAMMPEQVAELVRRWCNAVYKTDEEQENEQRSLKEEIEALEDRRKARNEKPLIDTPLMVTVVAIVHYNDHKLPEKRAELYKKCVDILLAEKHHAADEATEELRKWGGLEIDKKQFLALLAFEMMGAGEKAGRQVRERQLKQWLRPAFRERYGSQEAEEQLREFVASVRGRGSLLQERDAQYSFVHLTFQEFLCAHYLAETIRETDSIVQYLLEEERVTQSWWRETVLLTVGYIGLSSKPTALILASKLAAVKGSDECQLAADELATTAFLELESHAETTHRQLHGRLLNLLTTRQKKLQPATRMIAGEALGRLGDEREGVCTLEPELVPISTGLTFLMGDNKDEITIAQPFAIGKYPVTNAQYRFFVDDGGYTNPRWLEKCWTKEGRKALQQYGWQAPRLLGDPAFSQPNQPVVAVSWYEALAYVNWLREKTGKPYRLPTEAEWERAARYTDGRLYPWGDAEPPGDSKGLANYQEAGLGRTTSVGIFPDGASLEGVLDMAGNVDEWCSTRWRDEQEKDYTYPYTPDDGREDLSGGDEVYRVIRGGTWNDEEKWLRCAARGRRDPGYGNGAWGFRCCCATSSLSAPES